MGFYADLHVHSKFSRATSRDCDLEHMAYWARKKGVSVVGTGDFTHPRWFSEIEEKLVPAEPGLYRLRPDLETEVDRWLKGPAGSHVRFLLEVEISTIYKKDEHTRKVHHLIYAPDLEKARNVTERLGRIGNLASDGRPILGLDSRDLLEITLESGEGCYLIPAHIWTPWFAVLGSKSGFDSIEHCYGDLTHEIFAVETGLSSDPAMNRRLSRLDRYTLVSNSDAHSPPKIGREACVFDGEMDYFSMREALETGEEYGGTVELFAEEGKYHLDGHRKCGVCLSPDETRENGGVCPVCGKPLTLGVLHRVCELADRDEPAPSQDAAPYRSLIPLEEVLAEIQGVGPKSKAVQQKYDKLVSRLGSELFILENAPAEDVERADSSLMAEALLRMREGRVLRAPGFDGQYGTIRLFTDQELTRRASAGIQLELFGEEPEEEKDSASPKRVLKKRLSPRKQDREASEDSGRSGASKLLGSATTVAAEGVLAHLDPGQRAAAEITEGPLVIIAGPGTGKTRTLVHRLAHLVSDCGVSPEQCLAITFTKRAAGELMERIEQLLPEQAARMPVMTFHHLGLSILQEHGQRLYLQPPLRVASESDRVELLRKVLSISGRKANQLLGRISRHKRQGPASDFGGEDEETARLVEVYGKQLRTQGWVDFDDLIALPVRLLQTHPGLVEQYRSRYPWISVDEYQDVDRMQYELIGRLAGSDGNLCVIGDPDQSIYGFRGADVRYFQQFQQDFPAAQSVSLSRNYRSTRTIVDASVQMMTPASLVPERCLLSEFDGPERVEVHECSSPRAEAEFVVHTIERMIGGTTFFSIDSGRVETNEGQELSFADFAVLYRTDAVADPLVEAFARSGIPFQKRSHRPLAEVPAVRDVMRAMGGVGEDAPRDLSVLDLLDRVAASVRKDHPDVDLYLPRLRAVAARLPKEPARFLSELALGLDVDFWDPRAEGVSLLTLHAAKGLEFRIVFIVACEDGILPLRWGSDDEVASDEERRLFFVGMTRAQQKLILTRSKRRRSGGQTKPMKASPFLRDIEERLLELHQQRAVRKPRSEYKQLKLFENL